MAESTSYYFASRYSRHAEMRKHRDHLLMEIPSATVTSRWIDLHDGRLESSYTNEFLNSNPDRCWPYGLQDLNNIIEADVLVSFTGEGGKGGRHVEHGFALGLGKRIALVGPRENIFHCHPEIEAYPDMYAFIKAELGRG